MPRRKIVKDNMSICCLEKIGYQYIRLKVLSVLKGLNASGSVNEEIVNNVMTTISEKTQLKINSNSRPITTVNEKFMESRLFKMQAPHNVHRFSIGLDLLHKKPQDTFDWNTNENKWHLEIKSGQIIEGDQFSMSLCTDQDGLCERLENAAKKYSDYSAINKEQIMNILERCYEITISKIVVIAMKDHQGSNVWEENILIITSLVSLLIILHDVLKQKHDGTYTCRYNPHLPCTEKKKIKEKKENKKPEKLYPVSVHRVYPLTRQEMKKTLVSKLHKCDKNYVPSNSPVFEEVLSLTSIGITNEGELDQRCRSTRIAKLVGLSPDGRTTPYTLSKYVPLLTTKIQSVKKEAQDNFFRILQTLERLPREYNVGNGYLHYKNGTQFSFVELCNDLDRITIKFLGDRNPQEEEIKNKFHQISPLVVELLKIIFSRLMCSAAYKDDLMSQKGYNKWQEHVEMIISCIALLIGVLEYTGCTDKEVLRKYSEERINKVIWLPKKYLRRSQSLPCTHREYNAVAKHTEASYHNEVLVDYKHMRDLKEKIESHEFQMTTPPTPSDGTCQFHALAEQVKKHQKEDTTHLKVRNDIVKLLRTNEWKEKIRLEVTDRAEVGLYIHNMRQPGTWGDQISLEAAASVLKCKISLISVDREQPLPDASEELPTINLGYIKRMHYYSVKQKVHKKTHKNSRSHSFSCTNREYNAGDSGDSVATYSKHMRDLKRKLKWKGFELSTPPTPSNANCQFYALAEQANGILNLNITKPLEVREKIVKFLQNNREWQEKVKEDLQGMDKTLEDYTDEMGKPDTWGDLTSLKTAARALKCNITLISAHRSIWTWVDNEVDNDFKEEQYPDPPHSDWPQIHLGYIQWTHYTSVEHVERKVDNVNPFTQEEISKKLLLKFVKCDPNYKPKKSSVFNAILTFTSLRITNKGKMEKLGKTYANYTKSSYKLPVSVSQLDAKIQNLNKQVQDNCFGILQSLNKLPGKFKVQKGYLQFNGESFSSVNFCNAMDDVTVQFLLEPPGVPFRPTDQNDMDTRTKEMTPLVNELVKTIFSAVIFSAKYKDENIWRKHVEMIISCIALLIAALEYTGCTQKQDITEYFLQTSLNRAMSFQKYSGRRHSLP